VAQDAFMLGCPDKGPPGQICPEAIGPDWDFGGASAILQSLGWDGIVRAVDMSGKVIWSFNTRQRFESLNGVIAIGGSIGAPGLTIANGMMYVASGYPGFQNGTPGNVILAFGAH
jgi:hypothetical protein